MGNCMLVTSVFAHSVGVIPYLIKASSEASKGRPRGGEMVKVGGAQLGLEPLSLSKIADGSDMRTPRPHVTAVFDF